MIDIQFWLRMIIGAYIVLSGAIKFFDMKGFALIVAKYGVLPRKLVKPAAYAHPFIELIIGFAVLAWFMPVWSTLAALLMMVVSTGFVVAAIVTHKKLENCGCLGTFVKIPVNKWKLLENTLWIVLTLVLFLSTL